MYNTGSILQRILVTFIIITFKHTRIFQTELGALVALFRTPFASNRLVEALPLSIVYPQ